MSHCNLQNENTIKNFPDDFSVDQKTFYVYSNHNMYSVVLSRVNPRYSERIHNSCEHETNVRKCPLINNKQNVNNLENSLIPTILKEIQNYLNNSNTECCCNSMDQSEIPYKDFIDPPHCSHHCDYQPTCMTEKISDPFIESLHEFLAEVNAPRDDCMRDDVQCIFNSAEDFWYVFL